MRKPLLMGGALLVALRADALRRRAALACRWLFFPARGCWRRRGGGRRGWWALVCAKAQLDDFILVGGIAHEGEELRRIVAEALAHLARQGGERALGFEDQIHRILELLRIREILIAALGSIGRHVADLAGEPVLFQDVVDVALGDERLLGPGRGLVDLASDVIDELTGVGDAIVRHVERVFSVHDEPQYFGGTRRRLGP